MSELETLFNSAVETLGTLVGVDAGPVGPGTSAPGGAVVARAGQGNAPVSVSHVADSYRRYPGERLMLYTRVDVLQALPGLTVQVDLPLEFPAEAYQAGANYQGSVPELVVTGDGRYVVWRMEEVAAGHRYEFEVQTTAPHTLEDLQLSSSATLLSVGEPAEIQATESVEIRIKAKSRYLKFLPALYYDDELMGRFLMLFESFWDPIDKQINGIWNYFDPRLTPSDFLPWLATWSDLALDERWTEEQQRKLLESAARLYRMRGTKRSMIEFLEIYTGRRAVITEHRANNLRLGKEARFGQSVALGRSNQPHSFSVSLRLPAVPAREGEDDTTRQRREHDRRRTIQAIIEAEKPAHTTYSLFIEEDK